LGLSRRERDPQRIRAAAARALARVRAHRPGRHATAWSQLLDEIADAEQRLMTAADEPPEAVQREDPSSTETTITSQAVSVDPNRYPPGHALAPPEASVSERAMRGLREPSASVPLFEPRADHEDDGEDSPISAVPPAEIAETTDSTSDEALTADWIALPGPAPPESVPLESASGNGIPVTEEGDASCPVFELVPDTPSETGPRSGSTFRDGVPSRSLSPLVFGIVAGGGLLMLAAGIAYVSQRHRPATPVQGENPFVVVAGNDPEREDSWRPRAADDRAAVPRAPVRRASDEPSVGVGDDGAKTTAVRPADREQRANVDRYAREYAEAVRRAASSLPATTELELDSGSRAIVVETGPQEIVIRTQGSNRRYDHDELPVELALALGDQVSQPEDPVNLTRKAAFVLVHPRADAVAKTKAREWLRGVSHRVPDAERILAATSQRNGSNGSIPKNR
jgi:hypothetical protein